MASIDLVGLSKVYAGGVAAVDDLTLSIADGEFFALLGPSGCGKTTLLRTIAGLEDVTSGQLLLGGKDVTRLPPGKRDVAMVFQDYALFPHMDVTDNISYPLRIQKMAKAERREKAATTGAGLGLDTLMTAVRASSPAASSSGSRWPGPSRTSPRCSSSTSRCRTSTRGSGSRRAPSSSGCSTSSA